MKEQLVPCPHLQSFPLEIMGCEKTSRALVSFGNKISQTDVKCPIKEVANGTCMIPQSLNFEIECGNGDC